MPKIIGMKLFQKPVLRRSAAVLVITALILSMFLFFVQLSQDSLIQSLTQLNNEFVEQVDTISGTLLEIIHNAAMHLFYSRSLIKLRTLEHVTNAERIAGMRDLGSAVSSSTFLSSALIYNSLSDTMYTSGGGHVPHAADAFPDQDTYELMVSRAKHGFSGPIKRQTQEGATYSFLFFEPNIPEGGSLLLNVRAHWFEHQLLGLATGYSSAVIDSQGEVLAASDPALSEKAAEVWPQLLDQLQKSGSHGFILDPQGKSGWMYSQLSNLGLYYLRPFDTATLLPGLTKVRNFALASLLAVSSLLALGILYTVFVLYPPLQTVRQALHRLGSSPGSVAQEMDRLIASQMEQHLSEQVTRFLQGEELLHIEYPVSLILVDCTEPDSVRQVVSAATQRTVLAAAASLGCAVLVSAADEEEVLELCLTISDALGCRCLYGTPKHSALEVSRSYTALLELWQMRFLYAGQYVLSEKLAASFRETLEFSPKDMQQLVSALRAGSLDDAKTAWKAIFDRIRYAKFNDFRFFVRSILRNLETLQSELGLTPPAEGAHILDNLEDVAQLHQLMEGVFEQIVAEQHERRRMHLDRLADRVDARIAAGYTDVSLSVHSIADEMGMNPAYLGRQYKEATGLSIADSVKQVRIAKARELLQETDRSVKEIAEKVGFANDKYFFVVFKELVGMTPMEFRRSFQGKQC